MIDFWIVEYKKEVKKKGYKTSFQFPKTRSEPQKLYSIHLVLNRARDFASQSQASDFILVSCDRTINKFTKFHLLFIWHINRNSRTSLFSSILQPLTFDCLPFNTSHIYLSLSQINLKVMHCILWSTSAE